MDQFDTRRVHRLPTTKALRALVFDVDGVILDTLAQHCSAIKQTLEFFGWKDLADKDYAQPLKGFSSERIFRNLIKEGATHPAYGDPQELLKALYDLKTSTYVSEIEKDINTKKLTIRPGIEDLLLDAEEAHVPLAIASASNSEAVGKIVNKLGLHHYLGNNQVCHRAHSKPDPHSYIAAMALCGIHPRSYQHCVAVEDTHAGALSALAAGMQVVITTSSFTDMQKVHVLTNEGIPQHQLREYRRPSMTDEDIRELEAFEGGRPRKAALVLDSLLFDREDLLRTGDRPMTALEILDDLCPPIKR